MRVYMAAKPLDWVGPGDHLDFLDDIGGLMRQVPAAPATP